MRWAALMPLLDDVTLIATKLGIPSQVAQQGGALSVLKSACAMLGFTPKPGMTLPVC